MSGEFITGIAASLWLGILTSISPCPLATNIAAVSYIGKHAVKTKMFFASGSLYLLGRVTAYTALSALIVGSLLSIPSVSHFLQQYINKALGPILIITGMFLLDLVRLPAGRGTGSSKIQRLAEKNISAASFIMGLLFALAFCPVSAALFFGSLIPMAVQQQSPLLIPAAYGAGTALPVIVFAVLLSSGANYLSKAFNAVSRIELWARRATGVLFIAVGIYFCLTYIFQIQIW